MADSSWQMAYTQTHKRVNKSWAPGHNINYIVYRSTYYLLVISMGLPSCYPNDTLNFEVTPRLLKNLCNPVQVCIHTCARTHTHTHTHIYIYIYIYMEHTLIKMVGE